MNNLKKTKLLICVLTGLLTSNLISQNKSDSTNISKMRYCELIGTQKFMSTKFTVSIDYGNEKSFFKDPRLRDETTGKIQAFNSMIDALNYMANNGWELVQSYIISANQQYVFHYILKKYNP